MQIKINLKIFLFLIIFILTKQIKIYSLLMIFALIHELGHIAMGLILGFQPQSISIIPSGFTVKFKTKNSNKNLKKLSLKKILIAFAGPLTNLVLIIIIYVYYKVNNKIKIFNIDLNLMIYSNILICIFNLIPIYPLDGGRILKELIYINKGEYKATIISNKISNILIIILTILASFAVLVYKNIAILIILGYLWGLTIKENKKNNIKKKIWEKYIEYNN